MRSLLVVVVVLLLAAPAQASFPGANGDLVVSIDDGSCEFNGGNLYRVTLAGRTTQLTDVCAGANRSGYARAPEALPDGAAVLTHTNVVDSAVATLPAGGGAFTEVPIPADVTLDDYDSAFRGGPLSLFPDGVSVAVDPGYFGSEVPIGRLFFDGRPTQTLIADTHVHSPEVSPDGRFVAVQREGRGGLWLYSARTGEALRRIWRGRAVDVDWSPDSRRLVYATRYRQRYERAGADGGNLYVVGRDGTHRRVLVHRENLAETQPRWSPDGKSVAWVSLDFSAGQDYRVFASLWRVSVRTGQRTRIRRLERPPVEEDSFNAPQLTWLPRP